MRLWAGRPASSLLILLLLLCPLLLSPLLLSCSNRQVLSPDSEQAVLAYRKRAFGLHALIDWDLAGKLSIDDGQNGGSGRLHWQVRGAESQLDFRGALGRGAWRLNIASGVAVLKKADGTVIRSATVEKLLEKEVGWVIPLKDLQWWVLGVAPPGASDDLGLDLDEEGRVLQMHQHGWKISFDRYRLFGAFELPGRMHAVQGQNRVKLAVASWSVPEATDTRSEK